MDTEKNWWQRTLCGFGLIHDTADLLNENQNVLITAASPLPWFQTFYEEMKSSLFNAGKSLTRINAESIQSPEDYLFERYCSPEQRSAFWPSKDFGLVEFLSELTESRLSQRYLLIYNLQNEKQLIKWLSFIQTYSAGSPKSAGSESFEKAVFLLIYNGSYSTVPKSVTHISFAPTDIDRYSYHILNTAEWKLPYFLSRYAAELLNAFSKESIEAGGYLAQNGDLMIKNPELAYRMLSQQYDIKLRPLSQQQIYATVLFSQLKLIFPLIEAKRQELIQKYSRAMEGLFPWKNDYGEIKSSPFEMELRDFAYKATEIRLSREDKELIKSLREARNRLAHNHILSYEEICFFASLKLLGESPEVTVSHELF